MASYHKIKLFKMLSIYRKRNKTTISTGILLGYLIRKLEEDKNKPRKCCINKGPPEYPRI